MFEFAHRDATFGPLTSRLRELLIDDAVAELTSAMDAGRLPRGNADAQARAMLAVTDALATQGWSGGRAAEAVADDIVTFCLDGLGAATSAAARSGTA